jgi:hypothetical protein
MDDNAHLKRARNLFFRRQMYYRAYDRLVSVYGKTTIDNKVLDVMRDECNKDNPTDDEIETRMFIKITELTNELDKEEEDKGCDLFPWGQDDEYPLCNDDVTGDY